MEKLLFGCTPAEWWVWCYLLFLAEKQGSLHIILPRPGEDTRAEAIYSRKHLKRNLKALKSKRHLTNLIFPRSRKQQIEVLLPASKVGDTGVPNFIKGCMDVPNKAGRGTPVSPITPLGTQASPTIKAITTTLPENSLLQAKLKESLKTFLKQKQQGKLREEIAKLREGEAYQLRVAIRGICPYEPQGRYEWKLKLFVIIRYLQSGGAIEKVQRWMNRVASEEQRRETLWNETSSGKSGKSPSQDGCGAASGFSRGRP